MANNALRLTAIPLCSITAGELGHYTQADTKTYWYSLTLSLLMATNNYPNLIIILVVTTGFLVSSFSGWLLYKAEEKAINADFRRDVNVRAASVYREVIINFYALNSISVMFNGDRVPTFRQFSFEAKRILSRHRDIQALEWIPRVLHSERASYKAKHHKESNQRLGE